MITPRLKIILNSIFFVLGFSIVFALVGVLLQSILSSIAYDLRNILNYLGGAIIIFFGLVMLDVIKIDFLKGEHRLRVAKTGSQFLSSFLFGAAFAVGWTPCVGAILGAVLTLAVTKPETAFPMLLSYALGLGLPFIAAAVFIAQSRGVIKLISPHLKWFNIVFGTVLVILGVMVATSTLNLLANFFPVELLFAGAGLEASAMKTDPTLLVAFIAGLGSFLSPCVLPLVPAYLTFIGGTTFKELQEENRA